jgi:hydroxymethylpyrimidine pyrophosphatase-like HAD family hydrolase
MRCLYVDLDGTLLGPGASLLRGDDGAFSLDAVRALQACDRAGAEVVLFSGRKQAGVYEITRLIGQSSYIFELGCGIVLDGELEWLTGGVEPSAERGSISAQITASGAPAMLLEHFAGALEYHTPWSQDREVSHLFRGSIDLAEAQAILNDAGLQWLRVVDNGVAGDHAASMPQLPIVRVYHVIPAVASKAAAVARHQQNRGYAREECIAAGDSREDMDAASAVGCFWLVANGLTRDPTLAQDVRGREGVRIAEGAYGTGVYEAVVTTLAGG